MTSAKSNVNDCILKEMKVDFQYVMGCVYCMCVWCMRVCMSVFLCICTVVCLQSIIKYLFSPAGISHCVLFFFLSLSLPPSESALSILLVTLVALESADLGFGHTSSPLSYWSIDFIKHWGSTLSSVINVQIHSFLFIWGAVWSFPTVE